jgi:hypothetical protein
MTIRISDKMIVMNNGAGPDTGKNASSERGIFEENETVFSCINNIK